MSWCGKGKTRLEVFGTDARREWRMIVIYADDPYSLPSVYIRTMPAPGKVLSCPTYMLTDPQTTK